MKLPRFIKIPQYNRFDYKPLYYDERKERLEAKIKEAQNQKEGKKGDFKPDFKSKFESRFSRDITAKQKKAASIRLAVIIFFLAVITYIILDRAEILSYMFEVLLSD